MIYGFGVNPLQKLWAVRNNILDEASDTGPIEKAPKCDIYQQAYLKQQKSLKGGHVLKSCHQSVRLDNIRYQSLLIIS